MPFITQIPRNTIIKLRALTTNNYEEISGSLPSLIIDYHTFHFISLIAPLPYIVNIYPNESLPDMDFFTLVGVKHYAHINHTWYNIEDALFDDRSLFENYSFMPETVISRCNDLYIYGAINGTPIYNSELEHSQDLIVNNNDYLVGSIGIRPLCIESVDQYQPSEEEIQYPDVYVRRHDFHCKSNEPMVVGKMAEDFNLLITKRLRKMGFE